MKNSQFGGSYSNLWFDGNGSASTGQCVKLSQHRLLEAHGHLGAFRKGYRDSGKPGSWNVQFKSYGNVWAMGCSVRGKSTCGFRFWNSALRAGNEPVVSGQWLTGWMLWLLSCCDCSHLFLIMFNKRPRNLSLLTLDWFQDIKIVSCHFLVCFWSSYPHYNQLVNFKSHARSHGFSLFWPTPAGQRVTCLMNDSCLREILKKRKFWSYVSVNIFAIFHVSWIALVARSVDFGEKSKYECSSVFACSGMQTICACI